jgi:MoxR-like ATPase
MEIPYLVVATQNPVEHEGTYRLPEAQLDRFLFKIVVDYPALEEEITIVSGHHARKGQTPLSEIAALLSQSQIKEYRGVVQQMHVEDNLIKYIAQIVNDTRRNASLFLGASPRASIAILNGAKAYAAIHGRDFVTPEDVKFVSYPVLRHRLVLSPDKEMEGITTDDVIKQIVDKIEVPR